MKSPKNCLGVAVPKAPDGCTRYAICIHDVTLRAAILAHCQTSIVRSLTAAVLWICVFTSRCSQMIGIASIHFHIPPKGAVSITRHPRADRSADCGRPNRRW